MTTKAEGEEYQLGSRLDRRILDWRRDQLKAAGFPHDIAVELAQREEVDLHRACELVKVCGHELAFRIVS